MIVTIILSSLYLYLLLATLITVPIFIDGLTLRTNSALKHIGKEDVQSFLATPSNWPNIVLSSFSVNGENLDQPLQEGGKVKEIFGLPPLLPLQVEWDCVKNDFKEGTLDVVSKSGLEGVATDCRMLFNIRGDGQQGSIVELEMSYTPASPFAFLAQPFLAIDNEIALKLLLKQATQERYGDEETNINKFRKLMGVLYGFAGIAHAFDVAGQNFFFTNIGLPPFYLLPFNGQLLAIAWCFAGPLAFFATRSGSAFFADFSLVFQGMIEVGGVALGIQAYQNELTVTALQNAVLIQSIICASWIYSKNKI